MSRAARSLFAFGIYVIAAGAFIMFAPAVVVNLLRLPPATDGWVRIAGLLTLVIGTYDTISGWADFLPYIRASVLVRFGFASGVAIIVAAGQMPPTLLLLGATDVAGAIWTALALKKRTAAAV